MATTPYPKTKVKQWWTRTVFLSLLAVRPQHKQPEAHFDKYSCCICSFFEDKYHAIFQKTGLCHFSGSPQSARKTADGPSLPQFWNPVERQEFVSWSKRLISFSQEFSRTKVDSFLRFCKNVILLKQRGEKHKLECLLSQWRHFVVGKLLFRSLSCCVIMILGPFPFPFISRTLTAKCS